jgi:nucleotide-binding universal stress UspA family protein
MRIPTTHASAKKSRTHRQTSASVEESRIFKHILVPIDLSDRNARTLRIAAGLARTKRSRVTLLHVIQGIAGEATRELRNFYKTLEQRSQRTLTRAAKQFVDAGVAVRAIVVIGDPAREIIKAATTRKVALIVMGSDRVMPGRPGRGLGTISYKVGIGCPCPILLVK